MTILQQKLKGDCRFHTRPIDFSIAKGLSGKGRKAELIQRLEKASEEGMHTEAEASSATESDSSSEEALEIKTPRPRARARRRADKHDIDAFSNKALSLNVKAMVRDEVKGLSTEISNLKKRKQVASPTKVKASEPSFDAYLDKFSKFATEALHAASRKRSRSRSRRRRRHRDKRKRSRSTSRSDSSSNSEVYSFTSLKCTYGIV